MRVKFTNQAELMEKAGLQGQTWFLYVIYFWNKQNIHIHLICFDRNFDHPHINAVTFVPRKQSKKPQFSTMKQFSVLSIGICF